MNSFTDCDFVPKATEKITDSRISREKINDERVSQLYSAWSSLLSGLSLEKNELFLKLGLNESDVPKAPHLENCKLKAQENEQLDKRDGNENFPSWTSWKGRLDSFPAAATTDQFKNFKHQAAYEGSHPPWVC